MDSKKNSNKGSLDQKKEGAFPNKGGREEPNTRSDKNMKTSGQESGRESDINAKKGEPRNENRSNKENRSKENR